MLRLRQLRGWPGRGWLRSLDRDIADELQSHLDLRAAANQATGMSPEAARRAAARRLGNDLLLRERTRDVHIPRWLADFSRDLRFALRGLRRTPGFTAVAVLTLALGIGASTAMFSVVNAVLINTLPYPDASRLVEVRETVVGGGRTMLANVPEGAYEAIRQSKVFSQVEYLGNEDGTIERNGFADSPDMYSASPGLFTLLGLAPALGRNLRWDAHEVVISDAYWRRTFHSDAAVLGHTLRFQNQTYTVAGVLPPGRGFPTGADIWFLDLPAPPSGGAILARLKPGVPVVDAMRQAQAAMTVIAHRPGLLLAPPLMSARFTVGRMNGLLPEPAARTALLVLLAAVGFLLLIACANTAALLLARSAARQRELGVRRALGASRWRLLRQLLMEALCLAACGGLLGCVFAAAGMRLARLGPDSIPRLQSAHLDLRALGFALAAALLSALACGLVPALRFSRPNLLREFQGGPQSTRHSPRGGALLAGEIALTMVLLVGAALLLRSLDNMVTANPGFNPSGLLAFDVNAPQHLPGASPREDALRCGRIDQAALARIRDLPGVQAATDGGNAFSGYDDPLGESYHRPGDPAATVRATTLYVGHDYFRTLGVPIISGRDFGPADLVPPPQAAFDASPAQAPPPLPPQPVLVNQILAQTLWPGGNAVGQALISGPSYRLVVIGVVANLRNLSLAQAGRPQVYQPMTGNWFDATFLVRSTLPSAVLIPALRQALAATDPSLTMGEPQTVMQALAPTLAPSRFQTLLLNLFAALALLLALIGLYALLAYQVQQRAREIGVRMALGASPLAVARMILGQSLGLLAAGIGLGALLALGLARYLSSLLFGVTAFDVPAWLAAAAALIAAGLVASYVPARRATRVDPVTALRCD